MNEDEKHRNLGRPPDTAEGWDEMRRRGRGGFDDDRLPVNAFSKMDPELCEEFKKASGITPGHFDELYNQLYEAGLSKRESHLAPLETLVLAKWLTRTTLRLTGLMAHIHTLKVMLAQEGLPISEPEKPPTMH